MDKQNRVEFKNIKQEEYKKFLKLFYFLELKSLLTRLLSRTKV